MPTTAEQQLALELINQARNDPAGQVAVMVTDAASQTTTDADVTSAVRFFNVDLDAFADQMATYATVPPLAWNDALAQSANTHNDLMIDLDEQSHYLPGEPGLLDRMSNAGYDNIRQVGENIFAYSDSVFHAHAGFVIDWGYDDADFDEGVRLSNWQNIGDGMQDAAGHRNAILSSVYTEIGIAWTAENDSGTDVGPYVTTQHFGTTWDYQAQLLGVVIDDADGDDFYDIGEGLGGITIQAVGAAGTFTTTSWDSGGYQMALADGTYTVTFSGGALVGTITTNVTISGENVKLDGRADEATAPANQQIDGDDDANTLTGDVGDDTVDAGRGNDTIDAGAGHDNVWGDGGDDSITGGDGNDTLRGGRENDTIHGGDGDDSIVGQRNLDVIHGGDGDDTLKGGGGSDNITGGADDDFIKGGTFRDTIDGGTGNDTITGNRHDDSLDGGAGDDSINAGGDNDTIIGGTGGDWMKGGAGEDVFVFDTGHGDDTIDDFNATQDTLEITTALANGLDAAGIAAAASVTSDGVEISLATGDVILLEGLSGTTGLADAIDIV